MAVAPIFFGVITTIIQLAVWIFAVFAISNYAINSRSRYKGAEASLFSVIVVLPYIAYSYLTGSAINFNLIYGMFGMFLLLFLLEYWDIEVVKALDVMKQDFRGKFGEILEGFATNSNETFDSIADYEETKRELKEAVLAPIEHRELAGAYNIKPPKGILLFGPPGTGKTMLMRALANEIRAGFFYVKTSSILSPYPGEGSKTLSKIFDVAKKKGSAIDKLSSVNIVANESGKFGFDTTFLTKSFKRYTEKGTVLCLSLNIFLSGFFHDSFLTDSNFLLNLFSFLLSCPALLVSVSPMTPFSG